MNCEERLEQVSALVDGQLTEKERAEIQAHMAECEQCTAAYRDFALLQQRLRAGDLHSEPSPAFWARFEAAMDQETGSHIPLRRARFAPALALVPMIIVFVAMALLLFHPNTEAPVDADQLFQHYQTTERQPEQLIKASDASFPEAYAEFTNLVGCEKDDPSRFESGDTRLAGVGSWSIGGYRIPYVVLQKGDKSCAFYSAPDKMIALDKMEVEEYQGQVLYRAHWENGTLLATYVRPDVVVVAASCLPESEMEELLSALTN